MQVTEYPVWRKKKNGGSGMATSAMVAAIQRYVARYDDGETELVKHFYDDDALAEYLHQVNHIEGEGFSTFKETRRAVTSGAIHNNFSRKDLQLEHVCSLHTALMHCWETGFPLTMEKVVETHKLLLASTNPAIAGHLRCNDDEDVVFVETNRGKHVFTQPSRINQALQSLVNTTNKAYEQVMVDKDRDRNIFSLLTLSTNFFYAFECIHPFLDGNGRVGRILLATMLRSIMPFPNVLFVDVWEKSRAYGPGQPPFVSPKYYYLCFERAQAEKQQLEDCELGTPGGLGIPGDLAALVIEGVYVGWKRFFQALDGFLSKNPRENRKGKAPTKEEAPLYNSN